VRVPASSPLKAPWPVVRFQNIPSQKRGKQRRLYESEYQLEHVMMLLNRLAMYAAAIGQRNAEDGRHAPIQR